MKSSAKLLPITSVVFRLCALMPALWVGSPVAKAAAVADVGPNAGPKEWPANPAKHVVKIVRDAADDKGKAMIAKAEAAQPAVEALQKAAGEGTALKGENVWWYKEQLGIRIPFAITGDAVTYYSDLVGNYGKQAMKRYAEPSSSLTYQAAVKFHKEFKLGDKSYKEVNVVTMKLKFSQSFAATATEGMIFEKERTVVLDAAGNVLQISGDSATEVPIMAI